MRAFAVDEQGQPAGWAYREFTQHFPQPGWVEHDATEIADAVRATLAELHAALDGTADRRGRHHQPARDDGRVGPAAPARPATGPSCGRTGAPPRTATTLRGRRPPRPRAAHAPASCSTRTSRPPSCTWLLHEGGVAADADLAFGTVDTWVLWNLTGGAVHATDPSNASRTLLYDIRRARSGPTSCSTCSTFPPPCCPRCGRRAAASA